ncbi:unnamed protein product [Rotaria magnacalcarata]|uniref:C2 domain-containing protein n=2 Tax=Rotaria magnacalcarata TaxID=392030 RepID=A0A816SH21_9BILA|nr:unnamed protein product [Rotaria magnacalcarata]CAF2084982.1 unnamed protein product [Rotaria magnacalcarata]CAF4127732.1 unnamed protein product [Rotaria magnacalcarata]CAF4580437.1 unnamed protein product [Rotaria magnacalcarata]
MLSLFSGLKLILPNIIPPAYEEMITGQDVVIRFLSAENLPTMDLLGGADPYFIAKFEDEISYMSTIQSNTLSPKWVDEEWIVRNIPHNAKLTVFVYDKDDNSLNDDFIGQFEIGDLPNYKSLPEGHQILDSNGGDRGHFHLTIESVESPESSKKLPRYTFDGPCRYTRHSSPIAGYLTMLNKDNVYSTWKINLRRISVWFRPHDRQPWNRQYRIAQTIFDGSARSVTKQNAFKLAHKMLYGRTIKNNQMGRLNNVNDLWTLIFSDEKTKRIRSCIYTYIINDNTWRFSETGVGYFTDFASKHALHANCCESVLYAGQFHPRPRFGWDRCDDEWELVFDNWSGTYAPCLDLLKNLKDLLEFNFPGLNVVTYDFKNPLLRESMDKLKIAQGKFKTNSSSNHN